MSGNNLAAPIWRIASRVAAAVVLVGLTLRAPLAQQPAAGASGPSHAAPPSEGKVGGGDDIPIGLPSRRPGKQATNIQAPHFLRMVPAKDRSLVPGGPNAVDRNAIGVAVVRHDAAPAVPLVGHVAVRMPGPQPIGASGSAVRGGETAPVRVPGAQPLVLSRSTIGSASFTRSGAALLPLGGPAKPGATGINGTSIRPKH